MVCCILTDSSAVPMPEFEIADHHEGVVLSSEGFYYHIHEFTQTSRMLVRKLARQYAARVAQTRMWAKKIGRKLGIAAMQLCDALAALECGYH